jgi:hypothetical protein
MNQFERDIGGRPWMPNIWTASIASSPQGRMSFAPSPAKIPLEALRYWA